MSTVLSRRTTVSATGSAASVHELAAWFGRDVAGDHRRGRRRAFGGDVPSTAHRRRRGLAGRSRTQPGRTRVAVDGRRHEFAARRTHAGPMDAGPNAASGHESAGPLDACEPLRSRYLSNIIIVSTDIILSPVTTAMVTRVGCRGGSMPDDVAGSVRVGGLGVRTPAPFRRCWCRPVGLRRRSPSLRSGESAGACAPFLTDDSNDRNRIR